MKDPLKDYTVNATYLYKWSYIDLKLWKTPFYKKKLVDAIKMSENNERILMFYRWIYIISINIKYALSVLSYPYTIFKRITIMYRGLYRRLTSKVTIPPLV